MSTSGSSAVYTGFWVDHDGGPFLTLTNQNATALITFLAVAVTFAGNRSWKIVRLVIYQIITSKDGTASDAKLVRQLQVILRNVITAGSTTWSLLMLKWENWQKSKSAGSAAQTSTPNGAGYKRWKPAMLLCIAVVHFSAFIVAGILTSRIVIGREVVSKTIESCGQWTARNASNPSDVRSWQSLQRNRTVDSENYVRNCYPLGVSHGILDCEKLVKRALPYKLEHNVTCPFDSGLCSLGRNGGFAMDSGLIPFKDLGINSKISNDLYMQRRSVCAVIPDKPFLLFDNRTTSQGMTMRRYVFFRSPEAVIETYRNETVSGTYDLRAWHLYFIPPRLIALPIRPATSDHDASIILLRSNGVIFDQQYDDPWFSVHTPVRFDNSSGLVPPGTEGYDTDNFLNVIACKESVRFCSKISNTCNPWTGLANTTDPPLHLAGNKADDDFVKVYSLVALNTVLTSIPDSIQGRQAMSALQVARYYTDATQYGLEPEQWKIELEYWFAMGLARLQLEIFNTIEKPPGIDESKLINIWESESDLRGLKALCGGVKFNSPNHTTLSTVGIAVVIGIVIFLTLASCVDIFLSWLPMIWAKRTTAAWNRFESLELLEELEGWWSEVRDAADPLQEFGVEPK